MKTIRAPCKYHTSTTHNYGNHKGPAQKYGCQEFYDSGFYLLAPITNSKKKIDKKPAEEWRRPCTEPSPAFLATDQPEE